MGIKDLKRAGQNAVYRGEIEIVPCIKENQFHIVNELEVEQYLKGVVPNEMPVRFGLEALKAQSVAARNYVLSPRIKLNPNYDVVDSVASQVYFGANTEKELSNKIISEASFVISLPSPIEIPISAFFIAGASLTPSPVTATISPMLLRVLTILNLISGVERAITF